MSKNILAGATLIGTIIGAGVFAIPYVFSQSGVITCLVYFLIVGLVVALLHLFFGEIMLRTNKENRLIGFTGKYLGRKAKAIVALALLFGTAGSLLIYILLSGQFLALIFPSLTAFQLSLIAWVLLSGLVFLGTKPIAFSEVFMNGLMFLIFAVIAVFCLPKLQAANFNFFSSSKMFLPFGVFLFSLVGWSAVAEAEDILSDKRDLKKVIIWSIAICAVFYVLFGLVISGATGKATTQQAFGGLTLLLGYKMMVLAGIFGFLSVATSYVTVANYLKNTLVFDAKIPQTAAFFLACFSPFAAFFLGLREFVVLVSALGAFIGLVEGTAIVLIWLKAKSKGDRKPEYSIALPKFAAYLVIAILFLGSFFQYFYK